MFQQLKEMRSQTADYTGEHTISLISTHLHNAISAFSLQIYIIPPRSNLR